MRSEANHSRRGPLWAAIFLAALAVAAAFYFRSFPATTDPQVLGSDALVRVERRDFGIAFLPVAAARPLGLAFYTGARVPPEAYAYLGRAFAAAGYPTVLLKTPLNFAIFAPSKAREAIRAYPEVERWVLGGHSLGGAMAAARALRLKAAGLVLLAAYPGGGASLAQARLPVLSLSATNDGLATPEKTIAARGRLPPGTRYVAIAGGNHAQFGEYGVQPGDGAAEIAAFAQRRAVIEEGLAFMAELAGAGR